MWIDRRVAEKESLATRRIHAGRSVGSGGDECGGVAMGEGAECRRLYAERCVGAQIHPRLRRVGAFPVDLVEGRDDFRWEALCSMELTLFLERDVVIVERPPGGRRD